MFKLMMHQYKMSGCPVAASELKRKANSSDAEEKISSEYDLILNQLMH